MKIKNLILPFILLTVVGCVNPDSSTSSSDSFSSSLVQTNYVLGKRIYDADYYINGYHFDIFVLDEFPHFTFKKSTGSIGFDVLGNDDLKTMRSIYVADVNSDGHQDLCYHYAYLSGSSSTRYRIKVYDYYNEEFIYESGNSSFILDLDENKVLVTEEVDGWGSTGLSKLLQANRFL